jgi:hypothetical protein
MRVQHSSMQEIAANAGTSKSLMVSAVEPDGSIVDTVYSQRTEQTAFAVARNGTITLRPVWANQGGTRVPVRPSNNLLRHQALLFPERPEEYGDTPALLNDIESYIRRYVALSDDALAVSIAYVLLTWLYDAFNVLPYLRYRGEHGCGKSRCLLVIGAICYKPFYASGASSVSPIFHTLDTFGPTLVFDEADFRFTDEKSELVKILNCGNSKGFPVLRTQVTREREFNPRAFNIFGPKIVAMRRSYEDRALESRFLTIEMEPGRANGIPINLPDCQSDEALHLRNKLLMYRVRTRPSAKVESGLVSADFEPRMNQILLPLLSAAPTETLRSAIRNVGRTLQTGIIADRSNTTEGELVEILANRSENPQRPISVAELTQAFAAAHATDYDHPIVNRWVGSMLRRLGIRLHKSNGVVVVTPGQSERIASLALRYGVAVASAAAGSEGAGEQGGNKEINAPE